MRLTRLWLTDFRAFTTAQLDPAPEGITAIVGANGEGKTSLLEAVAYLATLKSFRRVPTDALVREGAAQAIVRAEGEREGREVLVEAEIPVTGRHRVLVNRQPLRRSRDLLGALRVSVFSPDDLELVKGGPSSRRDYLDDVLVALHPKHDALQSEVERALRQRNTLLKQAAGRLTDEISTTLDVWDAKLASAGEELVAARVELIDRLGPELAKAYGQLADRGDEIGVQYVAAWRDGARTLADALAASRSDDLRRGLSLVGPHRDDVALTIGGLPSRSHASQGEQRSLALALRLAAHRVITDTVGSAPILLLDDVFSELDRSRAAALVAHLPPGQALLTTAGELPPSADVARRVVVGAGEVTAA